MALRCSHLEGALLLALVLTRRFSVVASSASTTSIVNV
ncbi:MAG: hypothetical protein AVDCRST_MAG74-2797 [uncultured Pyrinomonadaceae bacterium]|uniref:Uncharacterized protein n=1 Tax=uncultured Pyrinomonadaceae bacterium TaxID=2283094 RepID=A0A6J4PPH6_9BACT|nr:MAG: hypothetical protein AVDCRST_MAG74-2797 [uncultured Pyrinomonadaceae bacterium]